MGHNSRLERQQAQACNQFHKTNTFKELGSPIQGKNYLKYALSALPRTLQRKLTLNPNKQQLESPNLEVYSSSYRPLNLSQRTKIKSDLCLCNCRTGNLDIAGVEKSYGSVEVHWSAALPERSPAHRSEVTRATKPPHARGLPAWSNPQSEPRLCENGCTNRCGTSTQKSQVSAGQLNFARGSTNAN